jgi:hypothetical protein
MTGLLEGGESISSPHYFYLHGSHSVQQVRQQFWAALDRGRPAAFLMRNRPPGRVSTERTTRFQGSSGLLPRTPVPVPRSPSFGISWSDHLTKSPCHSQFLSRSEQSSDHGLSRGGYRLCLSKGSSPHSVFQTQIRHDGQRIIEAVRNDNTGNADRNR